MPRGAPCPAPGLLGAARRARAQFASRALHIHTAAEQRRERAAAASRDGAALKRAMGPFAMVNLAVGSVVGSGIFVLTGVIARDTAGPAVVLSYGIAAVAALLSAFAYSEMAVCFPSAGGAYAFASGTFGELVAWTVGADLTLEYALSAAAVARGLTSYAAALFGASAAASLRFPTAVRAVTVDPVAGAAVVAACALLAFGVREASWANTAITVAHVALLLFVIGYGLSFFSPANLVPFAPFGAPGVIRGASICFFSFVGVDSVANAAEECRDPNRDLPAGMVGGISVATVLYLLMSLTLVGMLPYATIDPDAPFAVAFSQRGIKWANGVVAAGALMGIVTSIVVSLYSQTRLLMVLGRERLLPPAFGRVSARTQTPVVATAVTAMGAGLLALLFDLDVLSELVSLGTLAVYALVCMAVLVRRYRGGGGGGGGGGKGAAVAAASAAAARPDAAAAAAGLSGGDVVVVKPGAWRRLLQRRRRASVAAVAVRLFLVAALAFAAAACFQASAPLAATLSLAGLWLCAALSFYLLEPVGDEDEEEDGEQEDEEEEAEVLQQQGSGQEGGAGTVEAPPPPPRRRRRRRRRPFRMPLQPLLPCLGIASNCFLLGSLGWQAYVRWIVWMAITVGWYLGYGMWRTGGGGGGSRAAAAAGGGGDEDGPGAADEEEEEDASRGGAEAPDASGAALAGGGARSSTWGPGAVELSAAAAAAAAAPRDRRGRSSAPLLAA